jgi:hypothetical protein
MIVKRTITIPKANSGKFRRGGIPVTVAHRLDAELTSECHDSQTISDSSIEPDVRGGLSRLLPSE